MRAGEGEEDGAKKDGAQQQPTGDRHGDRRTTAENPPREADADRHHVEDHQVLETEDDQWARMGPTSEKRNPRSQPTESAAVAAIPAATAATPSCRRRSDAGASGMETVRLATWMSLSSRPRSRRRRRRGRRGSIVAAPSDASARRRRPAAAGRRDSSAIDGGERRAAGGDQGGDYRRGSRHGYPPRRVCRAP